MAYYTTELKSICENYAGIYSAGYPSTAEVIEKARQQIFPFEYPIFDKDYKQVLETKIIRHYYTREIGSETVGLWAFRLETRMNEIMPYYNQLYESAQLKYDPLFDYMMEKTHTGQGTAESSGHEESTESTTGKSNNTETVTGNTSEDTSGSSTAGGKDVTDYTSTGNDSRTMSADDTTNVKNKSVSDIGDSNTTETAFSDTPQGSLSGVDKLEYLTNFTSVTGNTKGTNDTEGSVNTDYIHSGTDDLDYSRTDKTTVNFGKTDTTTGKRTGETSTDKTAEGSTSGSASGSKDSSANSSTTDQYIETIKGKLGGRLYPEMIQAYRDTLINIDMMVIKDLSDLFMLIY